MQENNEILFEVALWIVLVLFAICIFKTPQGANQGPYPGFDDRNANGQHIDGTYIGNLRETGR